MEKYSWFRDGASCTVIHTEKKKETLIALCPDSEKADFVSKACNQFDLNAKSKKIKTR